MMMTKPLPLWTPQANATAATGPSVWLAIAQALRLRLLARLRLAQQRREIIAMGPLARMELHRLLLARGEGGIDERAWSAAERQQDEAAHWGAPR